MVLLEPAAQIRIPLEAERFSAVNLIPLHTDFDYMIPFRRLDRTEMPVKGP